MIEDFSQSQPRVFVGRLDVRVRVSFLIAMFIIAAVSVFYLEPVPQSLLYHRLADTRSWLGIANFGNVASNLPFALAGGAGLWFVFGRLGTSIFDTYSDRSPYAIFFFGVALVSIGSAYYHLAPDNARLVWDRLPMAGAFMALFSAFIADRIHRRIGIFWLLPVFVIAGVLSVVYWAVTEAVGQGDLRAYFLVQFFPMAALPVLCWLFPNGRYTSGKHLAWLIVLYAGAKALEFFDAETFALSGNIISGHTLKHLVSAIAVLIVIRMISVSRNSNMSPRHGFRLE